MTFFYWKHKAKLELTRKKMYTANALVLWRHPVLSTNCINPSWSFRLPIGNPKKCYPWSFFKPSCTIYHTTTHWHCSWTKDLTDPLLNLLPNSVLFANHEPQQRHVTKLVTSAWVSLYQLHTIRVACRQWRSRNMTCKFFRSLYNKTISRFGFCDIQNNQGLGKGYQPQPYQDIIKTSYDNCLLSCNTPTDAAPQFIWKRTPLCIFYGMV